jgi:phosphoribosylaminoimidazole carboxylase (NCAIR synthetase)
MDCKKTVGVLGGGQLGRMMGFAAHRLGLNLIPLDPLGPRSPAGLVCHEAMTGIHFKKGKLMANVKQSSSYL